MNFKIMRFNVRGLNGVDSIRVLRNYIDKVLQLDMLCIQEHKLCLAEAPNLGCYLWHGSTTWICNALAGYNNRDQDPDVGCGDIAIFLKQRWCKRASEYGTIMGKCAQFLVLWGLPGRDIGIINIYAPNELGLRIQL